MGLIIRSSPINGAGCYTTSAIKKSSRILEYDGPRLSKEAADFLYEHRDITYLFGIGDGSMVIDGHSMAMFLNHSCEPNCETGEFHGGRVWISALRDIKAGEELVYDYKLYDGELDESCPCYCGAKTCRGTMYSEEEVRRRKRIATQQRKKAI